MFARRAAWDLEPNPLSRALAARRRRGLDVLDLTESNPTRCGLGEPRVLLRQAWLELAADEEALAYEPDPRGEASARQAVAELLREAGAAIEPEHVVLTAGTSEAYAHLFRLLCDPGQSVLVPRPSYPLFTFLAELEGVAVRSYSLRYRGRSEGWRIDWGELEAAAREEGVRAIVVVHPNNPTGSLVSQEEAARLFALAERRGLALVSDEVFAERARGPLGPAAAAPATLLAPPGVAADEGPLRFVLDGVSKRLALPQLKLAWIAVGGEARLRANALERLELIADTYLSVAPPLARRLPALLARRGRVAREVADRLVRQRRHLAERMAALEGRASLLPADAGWYAILAVASERARSWSEERFVLELLEGDGVLVHPGYFFDLEPEDSASAGHLVLSLLVAPEPFERGSERLVRRLRASLES